MHEVIVATRKIYSGRIVQLDVHEVALPDGMHSKREVIQHPGAAAVVALDAEQNILLVKQYRIAADQVLLELPAGTLYPEEPPEECAMRELQEETGYRPGQIEKIGRIRCSTAGSSTVGERNEGGGVASPERAAPIQRAVRAQRRDIQQHS